VIDKMDVYRISEPMFRIHSRLFRVQEAILRASKQQIRASKLTVVSQAAGISALFTFLLTLIVEVFHVDWLSTPVIALMLVGLVAILIHVSDYRNLKKDEGAFDRLLAEAGGENAETWVDYSEQLIAANGSRLKMVADALDETRELHDSKQITDVKFQQRSAYLEQVAAYSKVQLEKYRATNKRLFMEGKRGKEDYESVLRYLEIAQPDDTLSQSTEAKGD
jgi:hypothetical protein